jgi:hypothetical protein
MKLVWTILTTALIFWLVQILLFLLFLAAWFTHLIIRLFVCLGVNLPDSAFQNFILSLLKGLLWPISAVTPTMAGSSAFVMFFYLGMDSLVWGVAVGVVIHLVMRSMRKRVVTGSGE